MEHTIQEVLGFSAALVSLKVEESIGPFNLGDEVPMRVRSMTNVTLLI
jgi:hypothetical protein